MADKPLRSLNMEDEFDSEEELNQYTNHVLVIGIDEYVHCPKLYNCVKDAKDFIDVLTTRFRFDKKNIRTLINSEATRRNIYKAFISLAKILSPQDNLIVYFSGHGEYFKTIGKGYWIPVMAEQGDYSQYLNNSEVKDLLSAIKTHHTFLISDSCFSGSLFAKGMGKNLSRRYERDPSRWALTAGRNEVVSDGKPGDNSPFAESLLYRLRQTDSAIGVQELCAHVTEHVQANSKQSPVGEPLRVDGHKNGQFVFHVRKDVVATSKKIVKDNTTEGKWEMIKNTSDATVPLIKTKIRLIKNFIRKHRNSEYQLEAYRLGEYLENKRNFLNAQKSYFKLLAFTNEETPFQEDARILLKKIDDGESNESPTEEERREEKHGSYKRNDERKSGISKKVEKIASIYKPEMVKVEGGTFIMGCNSEEDCYEHEKPAHQVTLSSYSIGKTEVTNEHYAVFLNDIGDFKDRWLNIKDEYCKIEKKGNLYQSKAGFEKCPVVTISRYGAIAYCNWLSEKEKRELVYDLKGDELTSNLSLKGYRLPTEAEWEYAARGGLNGRGTKYSGSNDINEVAWYNRNSNNKIHQVGEKIGNELGLYDMSGNVWEWCEDCYSDDFYKKSEEVNPCNKQGQYRVLRGGSWFIIPRFCRVSYRLNDHPTNRSYGVGFRLVLSSFSENS